MTLSTHITISEAGKVLNKPYYTVHRLIRKKKLRATKVGWVWLVDLADVLKLKEEEKKSRR